MQDDDAHRHAVGAHLGNRFQMSIKNIVFKENEYYRCPRQLQFAVIDSTDIKGDDGTVYQWWGNTWGYTEEYRNDSKFE